MASGCVTKIRCKPAAGVIAVCLLRLKILVIVYSLFLMRSIYHDLGRCIVSLLVRTALCPVGKLSLGTNWGMGGIEDGLGRGSSPSQSAQRKRMKSPKVRIRSKRKKPGLKKCAPARTALALPARASASITSFSLALQEKPHVIPSCRRHKSSHAGSAPKKK